MCVGRNHSYQIKYKNKPQGKDCRRGSALLSLCSVWRGFLLTQLSEVILYATPRVFGDEGFDQTPWLLLVLDISVDPDSTRETSNGNHSVMSWTDDLTCIIVMFTWVDTFALRYVWCSIYSECRSSRDKEHHGCKPLSPGGSTDRPWILCTASVR